MAVCKYKRKWQIKIWRKNEYRNTSVEKINILVWHWQRVLLNSKSCALSAALTSPWSSFIYFLKEKETFHLILGFDLFGCKLFAERDGKKLLGKKESSLLFEKKSWESQMTYGQVPDLVRENCSESGRMLRVWPSKSSGQIPVVVVWASVIIIECVMGDVATILLLLAADDFQPLTK